VWFLKVGNNVLSEQQQKELDKRRAIQQQKIKDIKAQLEALKQNP
jgi:uncharacterized small protein (DUF1192 family)